MRTKDFYWRDFFKFCCITGLCLKEILTYNKKLSILHTEVLIEPLPEALQRRVNGQARRGSGSSLMIRKIDLEYIS